MAEFTRIRTWSRLTSIGASPQAERPNTRPSAASPFTPCLQRHQARDFNLTRLFKPLTTGIFPFRKVKKTQIDPYRGLFTPYSEFSDANQALEIAPASAWHWGLHVDISIAFGKAVRIRRIEVGISSQEALADKAGLARSFVSGIELGTKKATIVSVWKLSQALECKPSDLWLTAERLATDTQKGGRSDI
jgi:DNA-binding Xre family transcriptional regulator